MNENSDLQAQKKALRREKLAQRKTFDPVLRASANRTINARLTELADAMKFDSLVAYVSDGLEVDLTPVMEHFLSTGRILCVPRYLPNDTYEMVAAATLDFKPGKWGIPEPPDTCAAASSDLLGKSLWLIPGVAFDETCMRLGRGKGIYDRFLAAGTGLSIGVFYEFQKCKAVPAAAHDRRLDRIVTESRMYCGAR